MREDETPAGFANRYLSRRRLLRLAGAASALPWLPHHSPAEAAAVGVTEIAEGIYVHTGRHATVSAANAGDIANCTFVVGREAVAVIDTGSTFKFGMSLKAAIRAVTPLPVRFVINTHMHPDHVFGNAAFEPDAPIFIAHHKMARGLAARAETFLRRYEEQIGTEAFAGTKIVYPSTTVTDRSSIDLGGRTLELVARSTAHTDNDLTIRDGATDTLLLGDLLFSGHVPTLDGSILGWLKVIEDLKAGPAARVVPGHGPPSMPWPDAIAPVERYLNVIVRDVRALIKDGKTLSEATEVAGTSERDAWQIFDEHHVRNVTAAFAELEWE